ncbi:MAG: TM1812 family CRISPR-associated protein [Veillonella sp.]|nr:TM1812 family CRISPR-associated protein [Veillonella sp.]
MAKDVYNIYLTFPSEVKTNKEKTNINASTATKLELKNNFEKILTTSETAIKYLFKKKIEEEKELDFTLDKVFLLRSKLVGGTVGFAPEIAITYPEFNTNTRHLEVLCSQIDTFYKAYFEQEITPLFSTVIKEIPCGDSLDNTKELGDNIIKLCKEIVAYKKTLPTSSKIRLYIDTTGGFRNAAMIFLILGRIMSYLGIEVADVFYTSWKEGNCSVHPIKDTYELLDLVAGFEEFKLYGSAKKLNAHFKANQVDEDGLESSDAGNRENNNSSIHELLSAMDSFSEAINISSRGSFEKSIKRLDESLALVRSTTDNTSANKNFDQELVELLQDPIEKSYDTLLDHHRNNTSDELAYIDWCLDHDYLQQALTLFCEYVPEYALEKGIIEIDAARLSAEDEETANEIYNTADLRSTSMRVFNAINKARGQNAIFGSEGAKEELSPKIDKKIREALHKITQKRGEIIKTEFDISVRTKRLNTFVDEVIQQLETDCEKMLNSKGFTLYPSEEGEVNNYTLIDWISFLGDISKKSSNMEFINTVLLPLRLHFIKAVFKVEPCNKYTSVQANQKELRFNAKSDFAFNVVRNTFVDYVKGAFDGEKQYKSLILYKSDMLVVTPRQYAEQLIASNIKI